MQTANEITDMICTCSAFFDQNNYKPLLIEPCCHIFCQFCLKNSSHCPKCASKIKSIKTDNSMLSHLTKRDISPIYYEIKSLLSNDYTSLKSIDTIWRRIVRLIEESKSLVKTKVESRLKYFIDTEVTRIKPKYENVQELTFAEFNSYYNIEGYYRASDYLYAILMKFYQKSRGQFQECANKIEQKNFKYFDQILVPIRDYLKADMSELIRLYEFLKEHDQIVKSIVANLENVRPKDFKEKDFESLIDCFNEFKIHAEIRN